MAKQETVDVSRFTKPFSHYQTLQIITEFLNTAGLASVEPMMNLPPKNKRDKASELAREAALDYMVSAVARHQELIPVSPLAKLEKYLYRPTKCSGHDTQRSIERKIRKTHYCVLLPTRNRKKKKRKNWKHC